MPGGGAEMFKVGAGFKFKGGGGGPGGARVEERVGIQTSVDRVWELIYDLPGWASWNPLYTQAQGAVRIGHVLTLTQALPGRPPAVIQPRVLEWVPNEQLHWRLSRMGGLATATHYIEIEKLTETSCIVANGELIGGLLGGYAFGPTARALRRGLREMNAALKAAAEAAWAANKP